VSDNRKTAGWPEPEHDEFRTDDEGGLRAPPGLTGWRKAWWWFDFIILVKLARLRFIAVLAVIGIVITQWDLLAAYYDKWTRPVNAEAGPAGDVEWFCPMHPSVIRDNPRDKCPICFMPLSKRKKGDEHAEALPAGVVNRVQLSPYRIVLAGVQTSKIDYQPLTKEINAIGYVEFDERGQKTVAARIAGRIDKLFVNETGQMVDEGDELASLYSPDLVVTVDNLLDAKRTKNERNLESARRRLQLLGIDDEQIDELLTSEKANTHLIIRSPITGHVIKKNIREGQYVEQGTTLYEIADLSTVWIQAQVYEDDLEFLPADQSHKQSENAEDRLPVVATTRAFADEPFYGTLAFVYPHVDEATRTVSVRFELKNPGHKLRPGSTATVTIKVAPGKLPMFARIAETGGMAAEMLEEGRVLAVPETSVIDTGSQTIVYRETTPGVFEGVRVKLGPRMSGPHDGTWYPLLSGLNPGDQIVTSGSFLVDAETRLNPAAGSIYFGGSGGSKSGSSVTNVRPSTPEDEDAKLTAVLAALPEADRKLVEAQQFCPILPDNRLGSMGEPVKLMIDGQAVFVCCAGCKKQALDHPQETLAKVAGLKQKTPASTEKSDSSQSEDKTSSDGKAAKIAASLARLSAEDRTIALEQRFCAVLPTSRLGSMGTPIKVMVKGQPVFVCCEGCRDGALTDPDATLARVEKLKQDNASQSPPRATIENAQ
jgi:Cu(I)/Ag(I) efflux system membrane fusion protein